MDKSQLSDNFGRIHDYLRISVTNLCNLQCIYCKPNNQLVEHYSYDLLTIEELKRLTSIFINLGIKKVRITGGEPLTRSGIEDFIKFISSYKSDLKIGITSNGTLLKEKLSILRESGVNFLNISLDTLKKERFEKITKRDTFYNVIEAIKLSQSFSFDSVKINTVVMEGINDDEVIDFVDFVSNTPLTVRFIEYMPLMSNGLTCRFVPSCKIKEKIEEKYKLVLLKKENSVSKDFKLEGFSGKVGFISPLSDKFCYQCSRLRITSDGKLKNCLFSQKVVDLKEMLRSGCNDEEIESAIKSHLKYKGQSHNLSVKGKNNINMFEIGG